MRFSGFLDIVNSIAVTQLVFFLIYLFIKGNKIPSTFYLKIHLISQLLSFIHYYYFSHKLEILLPFILISFPAMFFWAPTLYFYVRSRLFTGFHPGKKILLHGIPAFVMLVATIIAIFLPVPGRFDLGRLGRISFYILKPQMIVYIVYSLYLIYKYRRDIQYLTSSENRRKVNWLLLFAYGITFASMGDLVLNLIPEFRFTGLGYLLFWVFINIFLFKAIIQPDQFLGLDMKKILPVKLPPEKGANYFKIIEDTVCGKQLFLDPELSLQNVAQATGLTERIVSQAIRQNQNMNFCDYINNKRIGYAKWLLENTVNTEKNILEILYDSGFNSKSVFNYQFKKHTGQTPKDYRNLMQSRQDL